MSTTFEIPDIDIRNTCLVVIDVQPNTLQSEVATQLESKIVDFAKLPWESVYSVSWYAPKNSTFHLARGYLLDREQAGPVNKEILKLSDNQYPFEKTAPSMFSHDVLAELLETKACILCVGFDVNDCIISSVLGGHSRNLRIFAVKELCGRWNGDVDRTLIESAFIIMEHAGCLVSLNQITQKLE